MDLPHTHKAKYLEQAFTTPNHNGNLFNQENDQPVNDRPMVETGSNRRTVDNKRLAATKVGQEVHYNGKTGTIVSRDSSFVKIYNSELNKHETVPIGETYFTDDVLFNTEQMLWDKMTFDMRQDILHKSNIPQEKYVNRDWFDIPRDVRQIIKDSNEAYTEPSRGGFSGREPGITRDSESQSFRTAINPKHVEAPQKDKDAPGLAKSDVEHGMYGGISTDQEPLEATADYEEDKREGDRKQNQLEDHDAQDKKDRIEFEKNVCPKCGESHSESEHVDKEGGLLGSASTGVMNPTHGGEKNRQKSIIHKYNTRTGPRYDVTPDEFEKNRSKDAISYRLFQQNN